LYVGEFVDAGSFQGSRGGVPHQFGLVTGVRHDTEDPRSVSQHGASQHHLVGTEGLRYFVGLLEDAGELVEVSVGGFALDRTRQVLQVVDRRQSGRTGKGLSYFKVGLAVQIRRFDETHPLGLARREKYQVGWKERVVEDFDDIADDDVHPSYGNPIFGSQNFDFAVVGLVIRSVSFLQKMESRVTVVEVLRGLTMSSMISFIADTERIKIRGTSVV
jgi:hypothetical protein